jgi:hypothetical protein
MDREGICHRRTFAARRNSGFAAFVYCSMSPVPEGLELEHEHRVFVHDLLHSIRRRLARVKVLAT